MALKKLENITAKQIATHGVQALADRPNVTAQYGQSGLSPLELKLWFDKLVTLLSGKLNAVHDALAADDAGAYIRIPLDEAEITNLYDLIASMGNGSFASRVMQVYPSASVFYTMPLQTAINNIAQAIGENAEEIERLWGAGGTSLDISLNSSTYALLIKLVNQAGEVLSSHTVSLMVGTDKLVDEAVTTAKLAALAVTTAKLAEGAVTTTKIAPAAVTTDRLANGAASTEKLSDRAVTADKLGDAAVIARTIGAGAVTSEKMAAGSVTSEKVRTGAISYDKLSTALANRLLKLENQAFIDLSYDVATGVLTFTAVDGTTESVDLPLELITSGGYYDDTEGDEAIVLQLANGTEIRIPVDDMLRELIGYINTIHDRIYTLQKAPPISALADAMLLPSPTLGQIAALA